MGLEHSEILEEEPTVAEVADVCRAILGDEICDEIAMMEDLEEAIGLAFTLLIEVGEDPEAFLRSKGLLE